MSPAERLAGLAAGLLLCLPLPAPALDTDREQPIELESDQASIDERRGVNVFTGNVHMRQGSMNLRGDRMTVYLVDGSIERAEVDGSPASFVQRPQGRQTDMHATARRMEYYAVDERIVLTGKARVWDGEGYDFRSDRIVYRLADSAVDAGGDGETGGRVHITLPPKRGKQAAP